MRQFLFVCIFSFCLFFVYVSVRVCLCVRMRMHVRVCACARMCACRYICVCVNTYRFEYVCVHVQYRYTTILYRSNLKARSRVRQLASILPNTTSMPLKLASPRPSFIINTPEVRIHVYMYRLSMSPSLQ